MRTVLEDAEGQSAARGAAEAILLLFWCSLTTTLIPLAQKHLWYLVFCLCWA